MTYQITDKEAAFVKKIAEDQFMNGDPTGQTWTVTVCESPADKALLGSLIKKGYARSNGTGSDRACLLTTAGLEAYENDPRCK